LHLLHQQIASTAALQRKCWTRLGMLRSARDLLSGSYRRLYAGERIRTIEGA